MNRDEAEWAGNEHVQKKLSPTHPHKLISLTSHSSQLLATLRSEYSTSPPEFFEIDPTDTTQEVKNITITEAGPAQPMEQVNPHHPTYCNSTQKYV